MFDAVKYVQNWFAENSMNPLFALSEFCRTHKVEANVKNKEVRFHDEAGLNDIAKALDGFTFEIETWKFIRNLNDAGSTEVSPKQQSGTVKK